MKRHFIIPKIQKELTKNELLEYLNTFEVKDSEYSLDSVFNTDTIVLYPNHHKWEIYYMDERGNRNLLSTAYSENEAYYNIYKLFEKAKS